jgi:subtilisin-like proprotein convertase family protein
MKRLRIAAMAMAAALISACGGGSGSAPPADPVSNGEQSLLPATAVAQIEELIQEKNARTPAQRKISSQLLYAKSGRFGKSVAKLGADPAKNPDEIVSLLQADKEGRILCDVKGDLGGGLERRIQDVAGEVVASSEIHRSVRAWIPLEKIEALAGQPVVEAIRPALMAKTDRIDQPGLPPKFKATREQRVALLQGYLRQLAERKAELRAARGKPDATAADFVPETDVGVGAVVSQGSKAHGADLARKFYNTDGTGVKIGVLSDSDDFKEASIASGDLPADTVTVPGQDGRPGAGEGTAMMQIVHDVAPGAKLFFASAFNGPESFAENIRTLRFTYGCDIIVDDVLYFFESPFQDDIVAAAVDDVTNDGALYFSSAGNSGNVDNGTSGTWEGDFKSGGVLVTLPSGYTVHDFGNKVISNRIELGGGPAYLHWSDPGSLDNSLSGNDYDLFVLTPDLRSVAVAATDIQDGNDLPFEFLGFNIPAGYRIVIARKDGAQTRAVRLALSGGELALSTDGSVYGHNSATNAMAVAAVDAALAGGGQFTGGPTTQSELFTSDGPRRIFYSRDGVLIRNGATFAGNGGENRRKPDVAGADGVSTTLPGASGLNPFFGTSAAAPHIAGIAALIKGAAPTLTPSRIRSALRSGSVDIDQGGFDRNSGSGVVNAGNALRSAGVRPSVYLELGAVTATGSGGGAINPGGGGSITAQVFNNGGAGATAVTATLTSSTPGVTITQGASAYSAIPAAGNATNTTPFQFTVDPSVACGARVGFSESVRFTGRGTSPTAFAFSVPTGTANATPTTFSFTGPRAAIPDNNAAGVDISIPVSGIGVVRKVVFRIEGATCSSAAGSTTVGVDHSWVGDLTMTLTSPTGRSVTLMSRPGGTSNSGNNFCQTVLTDEATTSIQAIAVAGAPWTGSFKPASPLAGFDGDAADGTWTLNVSDSVSIDTGGVREVSLELSGSSCTP